MANEKEGTIQVSVLLQPLLELDEQLVDKELKGVVKLLKTKLEKLAANKETVELAPHVNTVALTRQISQAGTLLSNYYSQAKKFSNQEGKSLDQRIKQQQQLIALRKNQQKSVDSLLKSLSASIVQADGKTSSAFDGLYASVQQVRESIGGLEGDLKGLRSLENVQKLQKSLKDAGNVARLTQKNAADRAFKDQVNQRKRLLTQLKSSAEGAGELAIAADARDELERLGRVAKAAERIRKIGAQTVADKVPAAGLDKNEVKRAEQKRDLITEALSDADLLHTGTKKGLETQHARIDSLLGENRIVTERYEKERAEIKATEDLRRKTEAKRQRVREFGDPALLKVGSAREKQYFEAAKAYGAALVKAEELAKVQGKEVAGLKEAQIEQQALIDQQLRRRKIAEDNRKAVKKEADERKRLNTQIAEQHRALRESRALTSGKKVGTDFKAGTVLAEKHGEELSKQERTLGNLIRLDQQRNGGKHYQALRAKIILVQKEKQAFKDLQEQQKEQARQEKAALAVRATTRAFRPSELEAQTAIASKDLAKIKVVADKTRKAITGMWASYAAAPNDTAQKDIQRRIEDLTRLKFQLEDTQKALKKAAQGGAVGGSSSANDATIARHEKLLDSYDQLGKISDRVAGAKDIDSLRAVKRELTDQSNALADMNRRYRGFGDEGARSLARVKAQQIEVADGLARTSDQINRLTGGWQGLNNTVKQFFRYALFYGGMYEVIALFSQLGRAVVQLQADFSNIQAVTAATSEEMVGVSSAIREVALTTRFSAQEIAQAATTLGQAGVDPSEMQEVLQATANFASAIGGSIQTASDLITTFRSVFTELTDAGISDILTKAVNISKLTGEDLKTIVSISGQTAKDFGLSAQQYVAAAATLRNAGIKASTVSTGLRQLLIDIFAANSSSLKQLERRYAEIGEPLDQGQIRARFFGFTTEDNPLISAVEELQRLGISGPAAGQFGRLFETRSMNVLRAVVAEMQNLRKAEAEVTFGGAAAEAADIQMQNLQAQATNLGAALTFFAQELTKGPVQALTDMTKGLVDVLRYLTDLDLKLKSSGGAGLGQAFSTGAGAALAVGSIAGGGAIKKIGTGLLAGAGVTSASIGASGGEEGETAQVAGVLLTLLAIYSAIGGRVRAALAAIGGVAGAGEAAESLGKMGRSFSVLGRFFSRAGWVGLVTGSLYGLSVLLVNAEKQLPEVRELLGRLPGLVSKLIDKVIGVTSNIVDWLEESSKDNAFVLALDLPRRVLRAGLEKYAKTANSVIERLVPTEEEIASLESIGAQRDATFRRMESEFAKAQRNFQPYEEYAPGATSGIGSALSNVENNFSLQQQAIQSLLDTLGSSATTAAITKILRKFQGNEGARIAGSSPNIALMQELADTAGVNVRALEGFSKEVVGILNDQADISSQLQVTAKELSRRVLEMQILDAEELIGTPLEELAKGWERLTVDQIAAIERGGEENIPVVLEAMRALIDNTYASAEETLDEAVKQVALVNEELGKKYRAQGLEYIKVLLTQGKFEEARRSMQVLATSQSKYFDSQIAAMQQMAQDYGALSSGLPSGAPSLIGTAYQSGTGIDDILNDPKAGGRGAQYKGTILAQAARTNINPRVLAAMLLQESEFDAGAVSSAGAQGLAQFMPGTAPRFNLTDAFNPQDSIRAMADYMRHNLDMFGGRLDLALAGYNAGENRDSLKAGRLPNIPETLNYVSTILKNVGTLDAEYLAVRTDQVSAGRTQLQQTQEDIKQADLSLLKTKDQQKAADVLYDVLFSLGTELDDFTEETANGVAVSKKVNDAYNTYLEAVGAAEQEERRLTTQKQKVQAELDKVTKAELQQKLDKIRREGGSPAEFSRVRSEVSSREISPLRDQLKAIDEGRVTFAKGTSSETEVAKINAQIRVIQIKELKEAQDYARSRAATNAKLLTGDAQLVAEQAKRAAGLAVQQGNEEEFDRLLDELINHQLKVVAAKRQEALLIEDRQQRAAELDKLGVEEKGIASAIKELLAARRNKLKEDLREQIDYGAKTPGEAQQFIQRQAEGFEPSRAEELERTKVSLAAIEQYQSQVNADLEYWNTLLQQGGLSLAGQTIAQQQINALTKEQVQTQEVVARKQGESVALAGGIGHSLKVFADNANSAYDGLADTIGGSLTGAVNGLTGALFDAGTAGQSMGEAFRNGLRSFFVGISKAIVQALILKAITSSLGLSSGTANVGSSLGAGQVGPNILAGTAALNKGGVIKAAEGGLVAGSGGIDTTPGAIVHPGGSTSPLLVTHDEAILPAGMVRGLGRANVQAAINAYNRTGVARMATGGVIPTGQRSAVSTTGQQAAAAGPNIKIINVPGNSVVADFMTSYEGEQVVLNALERNPQRARMIMGG